MTAAGPPPNPLAGRYRLMAASLRLGLALVLVASGLTLVLPADVRPVAGGAVVALLVGIPIARIAWLLTRWTRRRDRRFAVVGVVLLALLGTALVL